jgi:hypothetical protein
MTEWLLIAILSIIGICGWLLYYREYERSRDYATDLAQVIHDYPESTDSLRRSLKWDEISDRVEND